MNLKALLTTAMLVVGTSSAAFAGPRVEVRDQRAPVAVRVESRVVHPIAERPIAERPIVRPVVVRPVVVRPVVRPIVRPIVHPIGHPVAIHPVWHPIIRPILRPVIVGSYSVDAPVYVDGVTTIVAAAGTQTIDLGAGQSIDTLRIVGDQNLDVRSVLVTYADGQTQIIGCNHSGSFETNLGGNLVTNLIINA